MRTEHVHLSSMARDVVAEIQRTATDRQVEFVIAPGLEAQGDSPNRVRLFTIAYSSGASASRGILKRIAAASGGLDYEGKTENIESVYRSIASFF